ncbi:hypothetical protein [Croceimicrobium sp.]|uniref:hypothetical protein n=1 Tax=Croceimicrobium sp. TaxID=2828340 RepID=UPI003BAD3FC7
MRLLFILSLSISSLVLNAKPALVYKNKGLQEWYLQLQNFEAVDLNSELLDECNRAEKRFAALQYHWQALLRGHSSDRHYSAIKSMVERPLSWRGASAEAALMDEVLCSFFLARAASLRGESLSSLSSYMGASKALKKLMALHSDDLEIELLSLVYSLGYEQFESNPLYWTITAWLLDPVAKASNERLAELEQVESTIVSVEASYYSYRILKKDNMEQAKRSMKRLMENFPRNWVFKLEYFKSFESHQAKAQERKAQLKKELMSSTYLSSTEKQHFAKVLESL